jgi:hypothetical protein
LKRSDSRSAMSASRNECLFCGKAGRLTKEHLNPRWLRRYVGLWFTNTSHSVSIRGIAISTGTLGPYQFSRGKLDRPGDPHSQALRVLCAHCNNVRMSALQERAKKYLRSMVLGNWPQLDERGQHLVATWAAMNTMVRETAHPPTQATSKEERLEFVNKMEAPPTWSVWIGKYSDVQSGVMNHVGWNEPGDIVDPRFNGGVCRQATGFVMGKLFMLTISMPDNVGDARQTMGDAFAQQYDLSLIWPTTPRFTTPQTVYDWRGWNLVAREIPRRRAGVAFRTAAEGNSL